MALDDKWIDAAAETGKENNSCVSTRFSLVVEHEQDDAGRGGRTCLARPNSQAHTRTGKYYFSLSS